MSNNIKESERHYLRKNYEIDREIIDEYYKNGFNPVKAVQAVRGNDIPNLQASVYFTALKNKKDMQEFINEKKARLRASAEIEQAQVLREQIQWAYSNATDYIGLSIDEFKALPPDVARCIQSFKSNTKTYYDKASGKKITEEVIEVKLIDKTRAMEMINKHIGHYDKDNRQKQNKVLNIEKVDNMTLNALLNAYEDKDKG